MESEKFISNVINSLDEYPHHLNEFDKQLDIQTFIYLLNEFDIGWYMDNLQITEEVFDTYFKDIVKEYDKSLYKSIKKSIKESSISFMEFRYMFQMDNQHIDRDDIFESIIDSDGYYESEYQKMKIVNFLQYFFDKFEFEKHFYNSKINQTEYEIYFRDTIKEYKPKLHKKIMEKFKNENNI